MLGTFLRNGNTISLFPAHSLFCPSSFEFVGKKCYKMMPKALGTKVDEECEKAARPDGVEGAHMFVMKNMDYHNKEVLRRLWNSATYGVRLLIITTLIIIASMLLINVLLIIPGDPVQPQGQRQLLLLHRQAQRRIRASKQSFGIFGDGDFFICT